MSEGNEEDDEPYWLDGMTPEEQLAAIDEQERRVRAIWANAPPGLAKAMVGSLATNLRLAVSRVSVRKDQSVNLSCFGCRQFEGSGNFDGRWSLQQQERLHSFCEAATLRRIRAPLYCFEAG